MTKLTHADLDAIEARAQAATPGPWKKCGRDSSIWSEAVDAPVADAKIGDWGDEFPTLRIEQTSSIEGRATISAVMEKITYGSVPREAALANAAHIAHSDPTTVLALVALARKGIIATPRPRWWRGLLS